MANAAAEQQSIGVSGAPGGLQGQGLSSLGQLPLQQQHGLLQPNLSDLLGQSGMESLLNSALAGAVHDPSKQPKPGECWFKLPHVAWVTARTDQQVRSSEM